MTPVDSALAPIRDAILGPGLRRATFAGAARRGPCPWVRVTVRPVEVRGGRQLQFARFDGRKTLTENRAADAAGPAVDELLGYGFAGCHVSTDAAELDARTSKKGKVHVGRRVAAPAAAPDLAHNRVKDVPLPEGRADRLLEVMGVLTAGGRVRPTMRAKFTQINEFLKHLGHVVDAAGLRTLGRPVDLLDCGCGASYLTLAAHHYLNDVLGIPARVLGVDVNDEVVRKSTDRAARLGAADLTFECGPIAADTGPADVVLALHACDTATDDAIARAVRGGARLVLCVPCCHHALNKELTPAGPAAALKPVFRHGILKERLADVLTDAFRAAALRVMGYRAEVVEFVSPEHTARNLLIRAVRVGDPGDPAAAAEYRELRRFVGATPAIERALGEAFVRLVGGETSPDGPAPGPS